MKSVSTIMLRSHLSKIRLKSQHSTCHQELAGSQHMYDSHRIHLEVDMQEQVEEWEIQWG
jgi:hypothetical protein